MQDVEAELPGALRPNRRVLGCPQLSPAAGGRQSLRCAAHSVRGFVAARLVTTVLLPAVVLGMTLWLV